MNPLEQNFGEHLIKVLIEPYNPLISDYAAHLRAQAAQQNKTVWQIHHELTNQYGNPYKVLKANEIKKHS